jgi:dynactin-5
MTEESSYIKTATHNYVSRQAIVDNPAQVELKGKCVLQPKSRLRGDLAIVRLGRYVIVNQDTVLEPARLDQHKYVPMIVRGHVIIERDCHIQASAIGTNVFIGQCCKIGPRCIIKDNCWIERGTVLGADTVVPPYSRVKGDPGKVVQELPPSAAVELQELAQVAYRDFLASQSEA